MLDKLPIKTKTFLVTGEYEGWQFEARVNPPIGLFLEKIEALQTSDTSNPAKVAPAVYDLLNLVVIKWNFKDESGNELPAGVDGLKRLPFDLLLLMCEAIKGEAFTVPLAPGSS
jgi:hypothetical protein